MALANGAAENDRWLIRKDGARFWAIGMPVPIRTHDGTPRGFGKILRNQTSVKMKLENWKRRFEETEALQKRHQIMVGQLAHEFRNTLMPLQNVGEMMRLDPAKIRYGLRRIDPRAPG